MVCIQKGGTTEYNFVFCTALRIYSSSIICRTLKCQITIFGKNWKLIGGQEFDFDVQNDPIFVSHIDCLILGHCNTAEMAIKTQNLKGGQNCTDRKV